MSAPRTSRASRQRILGWVAFGVLVTLWAVLYVVELPAPVESAAGSALIYLLPMVLTVLGASLLVLRTHGQERHFWGLLGVASAILVGTESYWTWFVAVVDPRGPQLPALFEVFQALAAGLFLALLITMTTFGRSSRVTRARFYFDVLGAMVAASAVVYQVWTLALFTGVPRGGWQVAAIASVYPVVGVALMLVSGVAALGWKAYRWRSWERLIVMSLVLYGAGLLAFPWWYRQLLTSAQSPDSSWFTVVLGFGYYLLFMAIVYRLTTAQAAETLELWHVPHLRRRWLPVAYPVALSLVLPVLGWLALQDGGRPQGIPTAGAAFALAAILIVRSWLSAIERAQHRELAITDPVSGAYNHRYLHERLTDDLLRAATARRTLAVIVVDVDDFKSINTLHGHVAGDEVLLRVAGILQSVCGPMSLVFRFGSDEFVVVAPGADGEQATALACRVQDRVSQEISFAGIPVSVCAGISLFPLHGGDGEKLLARALAAEQLAKVVGADDVIVYDDRVVGSVDPFERLERARQRSHRATVRALAAAVDARDSDTLHHSENVAELASALAQVLGMSEQQIRVVTLASRLHDIGKIGVRDAVLLKSDPLSREDRAHIEEHPILGERILAPAQLDEILPAVRHHHERWDGAGYPDGLRGPQIPLEARVLSVCDAFEAMTSTRTYRSAMTVDDALTEIERCGGSQFDPDVAAVFVRMVVKLHGFAVREDPDHRPHGVVVVDGAGA